jgi:hypothetical protein
MRCMQANKMDANRRDAGMENQKSVYLVEVSGWDHNQQFFVEHAALEWREEQQKSLWVRKSVRCGALLFVRLLANTSEARTLPVAYRVREVCERDAGTAYEVMLSQILPAPESHTSTSAMLDATRRRTLIWK